MLQSPMISCPLKQTNEVDLVAPLKSYIRQTYGDDPERYNDECNTLNRLRQDMRGAGKDSTSGRDLLYRYYGQLELLDLRFPVDENHIKISFTWFDAFTHKPTAQYSLAFEKASIVFNISAVLSCYAACQNRFEDTGQKSSYHSFQAAAGMFTYINENFLHAPSTDLSRDTVKTLIVLMLAQSQEVFLEKQINDTRKVGLLAKLSSQAAALYAQATESIQDHVSKAVFERVWLYLSQVKTSYFSSLAHYYQAMADGDANSHGTAIARLQIAEIEAKDALRISNAFPSTVSPASNLGSETGAILVEMTRRHVANVQSKLSSFNKDNDFIYHQTVPPEASLNLIPKLQAAKASPVSDLYQGQDIQRIIGTDIFQRIVPISVTESASLYDEEKAKLVRAEADGVETANGEMAAGLDYLKLPSSLNVLKGGMDQGAAMDEDFQRWCQELAGHEPFEKAFSHLQADKNATLSVLETCSKQLDMEESICEKMRSKYGDAWAQQPSSRLTTTLRSDIKSYSRTVDEAQNSDGQLLHTFQQYESDFDEMRSAGETDEADVLFQQAMLHLGTNRGKAKNGVPTSFTQNEDASLLDDDFGEGEATVMDQITKVEELIRKLELIKRDRGQVLRDLKEKVHHDDISNVLILNKKSISNHENQLFQSELEKFRPYQNRLLASTHKQNLTMKELTKTYGDLLQDKRVKSEQARYESYNRQRNIVLAKYKKISQAFNDLVQGLMSAQSFYSEMKDTVESLEKNVETFVNNRRAEGAQLLHRIEQGKSENGEEKSERERDRLQQLMERMSVDPPTSPAVSGTPHQGHLTHISQSIDQHSSKSTPTSSPYHSKPPPNNYSNGIAVTKTAMVPSYDNSHQQMFATTARPNPASSGSFQSNATSGGSDVYNPMIYPVQSPASPPHLSQQIKTYQRSQNQYLPQGYIPPPPPPGPPPNSQGNLAIPLQSHPLGQGDHVYDPAQRSSANNSHTDPWAGLNAWK